MKLLEGKCIKSLDNQVNLDPSLIPKPSFIGYLCASRGSGKTVSLLNLLLNKDMLAGKFNQIFVVSPTNKLDAKWLTLQETQGVLSINTKLINAIKKLSKNKSTKILDDVGEYTESLSTSIPEDNFIEDVNVNLLNDLIKEQKTIITRFSKDTADHILIVYDDCISAKKFFTSESVQKAIFNSRHYKISIIITSQSYTSLPKCLRLNMSMLVLFYSANKKEIEIIYNENSCGLSFKQFYEIYLEVCNSKAFNCMVINYQNGPKYRIQNAFEEFVEL